MTGLIVLDVCIGLVFIYVLYSLLASIFLELVATTLSLRARNLFHALDRMLDDEQGNPKGIFSFRLLAILLESTKSLINFFYSTAGTLTKEFYQTSEIKYQSSGYLFSKPTYLKAESFSRAVLTILKEKGAAGGASEAEKIASGLAVVKTVAPKTGAYFEQLLGEAGNDLVKFRALLEQWFEKTMERAAGWYKRSTQFYLLVLGFMLATFFNVNTIEIVNRLSTDPGLRTALVNRANRYVAEADSLEMMPFKASTDSARIKILKERHKKVQAQVDSLNTTLGLGWPNNKCFKFFDKVKAGNNFFGFLLTALAISLGAPFWFDLLGKLVKLRGSLPVAPKQENAQGAPSPSGASPLNRVG